MAKKTKKQSNQKPHFTLSEKSYLLEIATMKRFLHSVEIKKISQFRIYISINNSGKGGIDGCLKFY